MRTLHCVPLSIILAILIVGTLPCCTKLKTIKPTARFSIKRSCTDPTSCAVTFVNESKNAESYQWSFGDGTASVEKDPVHRYSGGLFFIAKLNAIGREEESSFTDTVFLVDRPVCETKGAFGCAKKLTPGNTVMDFISSKYLTNYYYFTPETPGPVLIELKSAPPGGDINLYVLDAATVNSLVIANALGHPGDKVALYAGPLQSREYYIKVKQAYIQEESQPYTLTYALIKNDVNEVNNSFAQATKLIPDQTIQGSILAKNDNDYFAFEQIKDGVIDILLSPAPLFANNRQTNIAVYPNDNTSILTKEITRYPGETAAFSVGPMNSGRHYIRVYSATGGESPGLYNLSVNYDTTDRYEINNSFNTSTPITIGQPIRASLKTSGDVDYFSFTAPKSGSVTITVPVVPNGLPYLNLELYSSANSASLVLKGTAMTNKTLVMASDFNLSTGQKYYLKALSSSTGESNVQYELIVQQ